MTMSRVLVVNKVKKATAGQLLFTKPFTVTMIETDAIDEGDIAARGTFTTGFSDIDRQMHNRQTTVWRTIAEMVDLWHEGVEITLTNGIEDADKINTIIQEHLGDCEDYHRSFLGSIRTEPRETTEARLRELKLLDEFGRGIYNKVRSFGKVKYDEAFEKIDKATAPLLGSNPFGGVTETDYRNAGDYRPIEERIDYSGLSGRRRYN